jgi:hypothetical protein
MENIMTGFLAGAIFILLLAIIALLDFFMGDWIND